MISFSMQHDAGAALITAHNAHPLGAWHGTLQLRQQRIGVRRIHGHQQAAGSLGVIQHILHGDLRLSGIHPLLGKSAVAVHPRREYPHAGKLQRLRDQVHRRHLHLGP